MPEELLQGQKNQLPNLSVSKIMLTENSKKKKSISDDATSYNTFTW